MSVLTWQLSTAQRFVLPHESNTTHNELHARQEVLRNVLALRREVHPSTFHNQRCSNQAALQSVRYTLHGQPRQLLHFD